MLQKCYISYRYFYWYRQRAKAAEPFWRQCGRKFRARLTEGKNIEENVENFELKGSGVQTLDIYLEFRNLRALEFFSIIYEIFF